MQAKRNFTERKLLNPTPLELIDELVDYVVLLDLQQGIIISLDAKLDAVLQALDDVNEHNDVAAVNSLEAFINAVEAQQGKQIDDVDANNLISAAQHIIDLLSV